MVEISTSILNVKKEDAIKIFYNLETAKTDYFHIDVMDGKFVEDDTDEKMNEYCEYLKNITNVPLDVHLMVEDVKKYIEKYLVFEPNIITIHLEAVKDNQELINIVKYIKENNCKVGISVKPETPIKDIYEILPYIHVVLIMTVEPGKGGQKLITQTIEKIKELRKYLDDNELDNVDIEADGGINLENIEEIKKAGCNMIVAGTSIIKSENYEETIEKMKKL